MIKSGLFPEERKKFENFMELPSSERPTYKQMAKLFHVKESLLKNFFGKKKKKDAGRDRQVKKDNPNNT
jgi:phosphopantetheinyl transferase (holo-ACP synthase)